MSSASIKVIGAGAPIVDLLVNVEDSFIGGIEGEKGGMELVSASALEKILADSGQSALKAAGGSAGNTIFGLANLGLKTSFIGKVGKDSDGDFYTKRLVELGGDPSGFSVADGIHTGRCLSLITPDSERTMRTDLGAAAMLSEDDIKEEHFRGVTHAHIEGYLLFAKPQFLRVLKLAKAAGATTSVDLASFEVVKAFRSDLPEILGSYVDIVFANEDETREFCGDIPPEKALDIFSEYCTCSVVKLGKNGSMIRKGSETVRVEAERVNAVDTTGAGDLWHAGFLYGYLTGMPLEDCGKLASATGAEVVKVTGAVIPEDRWREIKKRFSIN